MIELQYYTFWWQNVSSSVIYILALLSIGVLVNLNPSWAYDPNVILGNEDFNVFLITTIIMGVLSLVFAKDPSWLALVNSILKSKFIQDLRDMMTVKDLGEEKECDEMDGIIMTTSPKQNQQCFQMKAEKESLEYDDADGMIMIPSIKKTKIEEGIPESLSINSTDDNKLKINNENCCKDVVLRKQKNVTFNERPWIGSFQHSSGKNLNLDRSSIKDWVETSSPRVMNISPNFKVKKPSEELACQQNYDCTDGKYETLDNDEEECEYCPRKICKYEATNDDESEDLYAKNPNKSLICSIRIHKEWIVRIFIGLTCAAFVLAPIIIAGLFMNLGTSRSAFIYHTYENETTIIQVKNQF